jgi:hypothetical protein
MLNTWMLLVIGALAVLVLILSKKEPYEPGSYQQQVVSGWSVYRTAYVATLAPADRTRFEQVENKLQPYFSTATADIMNAIQKLSPSDKKLLAGLGLKTLINAGNLQKKMTADDKKALAAFVRYTLKDY